MHRSHAHAAMVAYAARPVNRPGPMADTVRRPLTTVP